jgi:hypothetical protein
MAAAVRSTFDGEHTAGGSVIVSIGTPGVEIVTGADSTEVQPAELVTVKVNIPPARFDIVRLVPVPVVVAAPGKRVITQVPVDGNPLKTTLPVGRANVGWVIVPITGAEGVIGCAGITTFAEGTDKQPSEVVTVKLYDPVKRPVKVELVPVPVVDTVPGYLINVQVPVEGKPARTALPVARVQVGDVIVPTRGAEGIEGCVFIATFPDADETHPVEFVTVKVYVAPEGSVGIVVLTPDPDIITLPGLRVNVHVPAAGNPLKITLPVDIAHVG